MCKYYPCHDKLETCLFCYCPIYPCYLTNTGGKAIGTENRMTKLWDCTDCTIIHNEDFVNDIKNYIIKKVKEI